MDYVATVTDDLQSAIPEDLQSKIKELRRRSVRPAWADFEVAYAVGELGHARVKITIGFDIAVDADSQSVAIDDPRLPFRVESQVQDGRLQQLHFTARPMVDREVANAVLRKQVHATRETRDALKDLASVLMNTASTEEELEAAQAEADRRFALADAESDAARAEYERLPAVEITQKDLRAIPFASLVKQWAAVARDYQVACLERWKNNEDIDEVLFQNLLLHSGDDEALRATREAVAGFAGHRPYRRASTEEETEDVLLQVVEAYKDAVERGVRAPRAAVADRLSYHPAHVGRVLSKARERGLLPPAKPRGRPTRKD